ncbi:hypothetical protein [Paenibacillus oleatilyticus]|uniref:Uncharacterized protein n=1 Tax=Paenibacillus oleatilyticus TaxID=2594886 RepID=A0ABV4VCE8_9BACL
MPLALFGPGFQWMYNDAHQDETRITNKFFTNSEAGKAGETVKLVNGRWTKASATDVPGGILVADVVAGTNVRCEVILIRPGDWFNVKYTGTPAGGFTEGVNAVAIAADGLSINAATVTGGAVAVKDINTTNQTATVCFKLRQFS